MKINQITIISKPFSNVKRVTNGKNSVFYSYKTPVITAKEIAGVTKVCATVEKYSQTTSKHFGKIFKLIGVNRETVENVAQSKIDKIAQEMGSGE